MADDLQVKDALGLVKRVKTNEISADLHIPQHVPSTEDGTAQTFGAGAVGASTPRITLASDDPVTTSVQIMDDWDESDRAKVNLIVGQAGIAAGAGAVGTTVPRVTLASNDPVTTAVQIMDDWDESDRAKVNPIAGQAGVAAGAGAVDALTQRVIHATDDGAVVALQLIDDAIKTDDAAFTPGTTKVMMAGFEYDDTTPDSVDEGDAGAARMSARREVYTQIRDAAGNERGANVDANGRLGVIEQSTVAQGSTTSGQVGPLIQVAVTSANPSYTNAQTSPLTQTTTGALRVTALGTGSASLNAQGAVGHGNAATSAPMRVAVRGRTSNYTALASDLTTDLVSTVVGALVNKPYSIPEADWAYAAATSGIVNTTTAVTIKTAAAAGIRNYITAIQIWSEALTTATEVAVRDGAGGAVLWRIKIATGGLLGGLTLSLPSPIKSTAATLLEVVTLTASGAGAVYFNAQGYEAP